jgi:hypothetical protein
MNLWKVATMQQCLKPGSYMKSCCLFNDAISNSDYKALNDRMTMNKEIERIDKEAVVEQ